MVTKEETDMYRTLESKTRCAMCGNPFRLINDDGVLGLRCTGSDEGCQAPMIAWEDLAAAVSKAAAITDLHLDFLWEVIEKVEIDGYKIDVTVEPLAGERKSRLLRLQDYWLAQHSMQGDKEAKEIMYSIHSPLVKRRLYYWGKKSSLNRQDLEDLEQAVWLRVFRFLPSYNGEYRLWTWIKLQIRAEFHCSYAMKQKETSSDNAVRMQYEERAARGRSNIERWLDHEYANELLSALNDRERYIVVEYLFKGRYQKEIAADLHLCCQRVHQIYYRALEKMQERELPDGQPSEDA